MNLSIIILTKNEETTLSDCLQSVKDLVQEMIIVDDNSSDKTVEIATLHQAKVYIHPKVNFADQRNFGLTKATGDWLLYLDADERLSPRLRAEIQTVINTQSRFAAFNILRQNFYLGHPWPYLETVQRLFKRESLKGWYGELHESPRVEGDIGILQNVLFHFTHRELSAMLEKTILWSEIEARLRFQAHHPSVVWWRFLRVMGPEFWKYFIIQKGYQAGTVGLIESIYQSYSIFITYARLYEMQNTYPGKTSGEPQ